MDEELVLLLFAFIFGGALTLAAFSIYQKIKLRSIHDLADKILIEADHKAEKKLGDLKTSFKAWEDEEKARLQKEFRKLAIEEEKIRQKEEKLDAKLLSLEKKHQEQDKKALESLEKEKRQDALLQNLETLAGLSHIEAREELLKRAQKEITHDLENALKKAHAELEDDLAAKKAIVTAILRLAKPTVSENTICTVSVPHPDMKGRIIGKDGRNIRTLERELGVGILMDDTPNALVISGFDPFRMHVAKVTLQNLIRDGRIHPSRIEETAHEAREESKNQIKQWGEEACDKAQVYNLHPELIELLGKLKLRFSLGQNVLDHSLEVSFLMGIMAAELGLDEKLAKRIGLLHDIGKAVSHEMEGSHARVGQKLALKCGESEEVANGIGCHHQEIEPTTLEGALTRAADTLSATRPGARTEAAQDYVKRLTRLEEVAKTFEGVEKAFALQAGREVHIFVAPDKVNDEGALTIAREISKKLTQEFPRSGKIKVSVTREQKVIEYAL